MRSISEGWMNVAGQWIWKTVKAAPDTIWGGTKEIAKQGAMYGGMQYGMSKLGGSEAQASEPQTPVVVNHNYIQPETEKPTPTPSGSLASALNHPDGLKYAAGAGLAGAAALGTMAALRNRKQKEQEKKNAIN